MHVTNCKCCSNCLSLNLRFAQVGKESSLTKRGRWSWRFTCMHVTCLITKASRFPSTGEDRFGQQYKVATNLQQERHTNKNHERPWSWIVVYWTKQSFKRCSRSLETEIWSCLTETSCWTLATNDDGLAVIYLYVDWKHAESSFSKQMVGSLRLKFAQSKPSKVYRKVIIVYEVKCLPHG